MADQLAFNLPNFENKPEGVTFKITTAGYTYSLEAKEHLEKLGIPFRRNANYRNNEVYVKDFNDTMDDRTLPTITIRDLAHLLEIVREYGDIIIYRDGKIVIYDDYME